MSEATSSQAAEIILLLWLFFFCWWEFANPGTLKRLLGCLCRCLCRCLSRPRHSQYNLDSEQGLQQYNVGDLELDLLPAISE